MKKIIALAFSVCITIFFSRCNQRLNQDPNQSNPDSVKKIIIALNDSSYRAYENPEKFQSFCEDSLFSVGGNAFFSSSNALSHDLLRVFVLPHHYSFKLFGNTAILSYLWTGYEVLNGDTIFSSLRNLRTFVLNNGNWKIAGNAAATQSVIYFKPVIDKHENDYAFYVGIYQVKAGDLDTVFVKDGKLFDKDGGDAEWVFPVGDNEYMTTGDLSRISFGKDTKGVVSYYTVTYPDGQQWECPKIK
jgi:hypothetical protein